MSHIRPLTEIKKQAPEVVLASLRSDSESGSQEAGKKLISNAKQFGLEMRDYLTLAVDPRQGEHRSDFGDFNGYEASLAYLGLPVADDFESGITLELASDTFQTFPGTRALFPEVVDDMVQWRYRQDSLENPGALTAFSRTINGVEMISTLIEDNAEDYKVVKVVPEMANIPVKSIRSTQVATRMWKYGGGYRTSYEFTRRARLDMLTPYAVRMNRELDMSKTGVATSVLINGDGVHAAAAVVNQSSFNTATGVTATNGKIGYEHLLHFLVQRAKAGVPVDVVVGNWSAYLQWLALFARPIAGSNDGTAADNLARSGFQIGGVPILRGKVDFALSSTVPDNQLIAYSKGDTLEELIESGSLIQESERSVTNQAITYVKSQVTGYRLVFPDTRTVFHFGA